MNQNTQARIATVLASLLGLIGLIAIGVSFGLGMAVQILLDSGCQIPAVAPTTNCQIGMKAIAGRPAVIAGVGIASVLISGGMIGYLRRVWP